MQTRFRTEQGSIPYALLIAIVIGGVVVVLFGQVRSSQQTARHDRDFTQAIQVADAGAQAAFTTLAIDPPAPEQLRVCGTGDLSGPGVGSGGPCPSDALITADQGEDWNYAWEARRGADGRWEVRSTGCFGGSCRIVELLAGDAGVFPVQLFAQCNDEVNCSTVSGGGSTNFNVYDATGALSQPLAIGANHELPTINGNYGDTAVLECFGDAAECETKVPIRFPDLAAWAFTAPGSVTEADDAFGSPFLGVCAGETPQPFVVSQGQHVTIDRGTDLCVSQINVDRSASIRVVGTGNDPVRIFVAPGAGTAIQAGGAGQSAGNLTLINVESSQLTEPLTPPVPVSTDLQIYVSGGAIDFGNNSLRIAATLYAPNSACDFTAQATMLGAAICDTVEAIGGFRFWYDVRASEIEGAPWSETGWSEQFPSTSAFGWAGS